MQKNIQKNLQKGLQKRIKNIAIWLFKLSIAAILAFAVLNLFCMFFFNYGIRTDSENGTTDYVWKTGYFCQYYEGFGYGMRGQDGFNNAYKVSQDNNIDILVLGSSQMEASNVPYNKNTVYLLNELFDENGNDIYAYNMAMEGHRIERQVNHLENALSFYAPQKYIILETMDVQLDADSMRKVLDGEYEPLSYKDSSVIAHYAKKSPYVRLMYQQYLAAKSNRNKTEFQDIVSVIDQTSLLEDEDTNTEDTNTKDSNNEGQGYTEEELAILNDFLCYIKSLCDDSNCKPIIMYIPAGYVSGYGTNREYTFVHDALCQEQFKNACNDNGVIFVDFTDIFYKYYLDCKKLPYGFDNTECGEGHLNIGGHKVIADHLYEVIMNDLGGEK